MATYGSLLDNVAKNLVLRVRGAKREEQIVQLRSAKCTIGSAPHCTLRLVARGVSPVHCVVLRGPSTTVVRKWSPDTRLNGADFDEVSLAFGDRLAIGPIELEVVDPDTLSSDQTPDGSAGSIPSATVSAERSEDLLAEERRQWAARCKEQEEQIARRLADLDAWHAEQQDQLRTQTEHLECLQEELASRLREVDGRQAEVAAREAAVEAETARLENLRRQMELAPPPPTGADASASPADNPSGGAPLQSELVFRRLGIVYPTDEDEPVLPVQEPCAAQQASGIMPSTPVAPHATCTEGEEESVQQCMRRLLSRTRQAAGGTPTPEPQTDDGAAEVASDETAEASSTQLAPRAAPPERTANIAAMRHLANLSAQNALDRHAQDRLHHAIRDKLLLALLGLVLGSLMMGLWWQGQLGDGGLSTGLAGYLIAAVWGVQYVVLRRRKMG